MLAPNFFVLFSLTRIKIMLIEGNAKCRHLKKLTSKGTSRQVFICLRPRTPYPPPPPLHTVYGHTVYTVYLFTQGRGGERIEPERRLEGQQFTKLGRKISTPINSDEHLPLSPFTVQFFSMTTFCFGVYIVD